MKLAILHALIHADTPILWLHGMADRTVPFESGEAGLHFLEQAGICCEFKVIIRVLLSDPPLI